MCALVLVDDGGDDDGNWRKREKRGKKRAGGAGEYIVFWLGNRAYMTSLLSGQLRAFGAFSPRFRGWERSPAGESIGQKQGMASLFSHFRALLTGARPESEAATTHFSKIDAQAALTRHAFVGGGEIAYRIAMARLPSRLGVLVLHDDTPGHSAPPQLNQRARNMDASYLPLFLYANALHLQFLFDICRNLSQCSLRCRPIGMSRAATCR